MRCQGLRNESRGKDICCVEYLKGNDGERDESGQVDPANSRASARLLLPLTATIPILGLCPSTPFIASKERYSRRGVS